MPGHGLRVAAGHRAGQPRVPSRNALSRAADKQRREHPGGIGHPGRAEHVRGLRDQGDEVVGRAGQPGVVQRAGRLVDEDGSPPISMTSASAAGLAVPARSPRSRFPEPVEVVAAAGERHHRVQRQRERAGAVAGSSTARPYRPLVCASSRPASGASVAASPAPGRAARHRGRSAGRGRRRGAPGRAGMTAPGKSRAPGAPRSDTADTATTWCPARSSAAPSTVPTRPAPITPTLSRAGCLAAGSVPEAPGWEFGSGFIRIMATRPGLQADEDAAPPPLECQCDAIL